MRSLRSTCALILVATGCAGTPRGPAPAAPSAPGSTAAPAAGTLPPIVDREIFFGDPVISGAQISPDGAFITFRKPYKGTMNLWVKRTEEPFEAARPLTADTKRPVRSAFWAQDGSRVLFVQDKGGDENFRVYAVDPRAGAEPATGVPPARDLTPYPGVRAMIYALPEKTPSEILVGLNDRDPQVHDVYRLDLRTGRRTLVQKNQANVADWEVDLEGRVRLGMRMTKDGGTELLRVEPRGALTPIYACTAEETCNVVRVHKDGRRAYVASNRGTPDLTRLVLLDLATGKEELVESDPDGDTDFGGARFSDATEELLATFYVGDRLRTYPKDPRFAQDWEVVRKALPDGDVEFRNGTEDDRRWIVTVTSDVDPGATYLYDRATARVQLLYRPYPDLPLAHLAPMKPVRYRARDGVTIRGYLTVPKGLAARGLPTIVLPHGGPWARDEWGYAPLVQFLANRGYAVLQPNFRGSTGFGKKFLNLGNGQWGTGTMQHDLTDGARWLAAEGIADPKRIGILGGSYGGYATLAGLAFTPDLYACGVDIVGPSSILTLLRSIPPYWAPMKKIFAIRVGDVEKPEDAARLQAQSPLHAARAIKAPLLVIQGANDPRVKKAESDQIIVALRDLGRQVEYVVAEDEGHGFAGQTNRIAMNVIIERFLAKHLGGRHQAGMAPEIAERVKSLTVPLERVKSAAAPLR